MMLHPELTFGQNILSSQPNNMVFASDQRERVRGG
jgi:hypothetical protein